MGRIGKTAQRDISNAYRYLIVDRFEEKDLDFIDYTEEGGCLYLGKDWKDGNHQTYVIGLSGKMVSFLKELIKYKFGTIDLTSGAWHYFVWSKDKPVIICNMYPCGTPNLSPVAQIMLSPGWIVMLPGTSGANARSMPASDGLARRGAVAPSLVLKYSIYILPPMVAL